MHRILVVTRTPAPSIVAGTAVRRIGHDRHAHVKRLDQRHAESFVLARAEEHVGELVIRHQLFVAHVAEEVDVGGADARDELLEHRDVALEAAMRSDEQQPRARIEPALVGVEPADDILDPLVRESSGRRTAR